MISLGGKYAGIYTKELKNNDESYLIAYRDELGKSVRYVIGKKSTGMTKTLAGSRIFSVVKGLADGEAKINVNKKVFPSDERVKGEHLKDDMKAMISKVEASLK